MGRQRRAGCRRRALHRLHADALFRQRLRRSAGQPELGAALRDHRPGRLRDPGVSQTTTASIDPDTGEQTSTPNFIRAFSIWGGTLQYSMPYLKSAVVDLGLPDFVNRLIPIVEASHANAGLEHGNIRHRDHRHHQSRHHLCRQYVSRLAVEAMIPVNRQSGARHRHHRTAALLSSTTFSRTRWDVRSSRTASIQGGRCSAANHAHQI